MISSRPSRLIACSLDSVLFDSFVIRFSLRNQRSRDDWVRANWPTASKPPRLDVKFSNLQTGIVLAARSASTIFIRTQVWRAR